MKNAPPLQHTRYYLSQPMSMQNMVSRVNQYQPLHGGPYPPPQGNQYPSKNMEAIPSSQNPYTNQGQGNQYSPFPAQQQSNPPVQNNVGVNPVQPSHAQQQSSFD